MLSSDVTQPMQGALNTSQTFLNQQTAFASTMLGERIDEVAASLRKVADQLRADSSPPIVTNLADRGAQRLERAGEYFRSADAHTLLGDAERVVRGNPLLAISIAYVAGVSVSRFLKTSAGPQAGSVDNGTENVS
jgi:hypothetical protein